MTDHMVEIEFDGGGVVHLKPESWPAVKAALFTGANWLDCEDVDGMQVVISLDSALVARLVTPEGLAKVRGKRAEESADRRDWGPGANSDRREW